MRSRLNVLNNKFLITVTHFSVEKQSSVHDNGACSRWLLYKKRLRPDATSLWSSYIHGNDRISRFIQISLIITA